MGTLVLLACMCVYGSVANDPGKTRGQRRNLDDPTESSTMPNDLNSMTQPEPGKPMPDPGSDSAGETVPTNNDTDPGISPPPEPWTWKKIALHTALTLVCLLVGGSHLAEKLSRANEDKEEALRAQHRKQDEAARREQVAQRIAGTMILVMIETDRNR